MINVERTKVIARNIKFARRLTGLNQTEFGRIFNLTRGNIDSYERNVCNAPEDIVERIAKHAGINTEIFKTKDLQLNPGLMYINPPIRETKPVSFEDIIKVKDETISEMRKTIAFLQNQIEILQNKLFENLPKKTL